MVATRVLSSPTIKVVIAYPANSHPFIQEISTTPIRGERKTRVDPITYPALVEVRVSGEGNAPHPKTNASLIGSVVSQRLRQVGYHMTSDLDWKYWELEMQDEETGLTVFSHLHLSQHHPVLRSRSSVRNDSSSDTILHQLSSLSVGGVTSTADWWDTYEMWTAKNSWFREAQWQKNTLPELGLDDFGFGFLEPEIRDSKDFHALSNRSTFTTLGHLPMGMLKHKDGSDLWLWQVENSGAWRSEIGDLGKSMYIATSGPEAVGHDWRLKLSPGETFTSCWTAVLHSEGQVTTDDAFAALTTYRRSIIRPHPDHDHLPIIFNDYMNCLMGDPTEAKILALIEPVTNSGAEYFVIDAGWYADDTDWWYDVGEWQPSTKRFPTGFKKLLDTIQEAGLKPGLWIEPEVIGVNCKLAEPLPSECYLQRDGNRIIEAGRYHLDYRHQATRDRMDGVIDRLVNGLGVGYFKFDYNIQHVLGTDINCFSPGEGQAGHSQAYLAWVGRLLDRYPRLVIENCSSGGMRMDHAMLSTHTLQSTSDQQDPVHYAVIAAAIPTAVLPEQSASWAYAQPDWPDEINALTVANSLLGRIHLSGRLDLLSPSQLDLVYEGMNVYKGLRGHLRKATPFWPLGLPTWQDKWLALGMKCNEDGLDRAYITVWRRGGDRTCRLPLRFWDETTKVTVKLLYPAKFEAESRWDDGSLEIIVPGTTCARLFQLDA
jgi:alpha-galactosidase